MDKGEEVYVCGQKMERAKKRIQITTTGRGGEIDRGWAMEKQSKR